MRDEKNSEKTHTENAYEKDWIHNFAGDTHSCRKLAGDVGPDGEQWLRSLDHHMIFTNVDVSSDMRDAGRGSPRAHRMGDGSDNGAHNALVTPAASNVDPNAPNAPGAPLFNRFLLLIIPALLLGTFGRPLLRPIMTIVEQNWWSERAHPGHTCDHAPKTDQICKDALSSANLADTISKSVSAALTIFIAPVLGRMSDRYGRRPLIIAGAFVQLAHPVMLFLINKRAVSFLWCVGPLRRTLD